MRSSLLAGARRLWGALLVLAWVSSCGGNGGPDGTVGPEGATIIGAWGVRVVVPPGALAERAPLSVETAPDDAPPPPPGAEPRSEVIGMTPHGQAFLLPVTVTIPFAGDSRSALRLMTARPGEPWAEVPGAEVHDKVMVGTVDHFSHFLVVDP